LVGLAAVAEQDPQGADIDLHAVGVPDDGLAATIAANIAGLDVSGSGKLTLADDGVPGFTGPLRFRSDAVEPFLATAGLAIPGNPGGTAVDASGTLAVSGSTGEISWQDGTFGDRHVGGAVKFSRVAEQGWRLDGDLAVDRADLGWLMALGLGASPLPDFEAGEPWAKMLFSEPGYGPVSGKLGVTANRLGLGGTLEVAGARMAIALQPQRIDVDLVEGHLRGAAASGGVSIHNVGGNVNLAGRFN